MSEIADWLDQPPEVAGSQSRRIAMIGTRSGVQNPGARFRPLQITWEMTRECEWKATSVRAAARTRRERAHFSTAEAYHLIEQVAAMRVPLLALTGGDPLCRPDLFPVIEFAAKHSVRTALTLLPTPKLDRSLIPELKELGLIRVGMWLHGSTASLHDAFWGVAGSQRRTLEIIGACHEAQLPVQINTIVARRNVHDVDPMLELLTRLDVELWNVIFYVPASAGERAEMLNADETELILAKLYKASGQVHFHIKTTEGQHYQRYVLQQRARESKIRFLESDAVRYPPRKVNDNRGYVFIDYKGDVYPSRFLPLSAGNVTQNDLSDLYSEAPLFASLRDSSRLKGKCGRCPVRSVCGGSRARAYALTGDLFAEEPSCAYEP